MTLAALRESVIKAGLDASGYERGARQVEAANARMTQSGQQVATQTEKVERAQLSGSRAFERLQRELDRTYGAQQRFERAQRSIADAAQRGLVTQQRGNDLLAMARERYLGISAATDQVTTKTGAFRSAVAGLSGPLGSVGSQVAALGTGGVAAVAAVATAFVALAAGVARVGDAFQGQMARLQAATGSIESAEEVYRRLYGLSQQTGVSVADAASAFTRFRVAATEIGATNDQVIRLVQGLQSAAVVSGTAGREAGAAIQQFGQALASGKLQGDELRSILENMPQFAQALARELGVGIGELRQMGERGELLASRIFPAAIAAGERFNEQLDKMPPTIARAASALGEAMTNFVGRLDQALGLSQGIARAIQAAASAVDAVAGAAFPTDRARLVSARDAARSRMGALEDQIARAGDIRSLGIGQLAGPDDRRMDTTGLRQQLAAAEAEWRRHTEALAEIDRDGATARFGEYVSAQQKAADERRARHAKEIADYREKNDKKFAAEKKYSDDIKRINEWLAAGSIDVAEADRMRARATDVLRESVDKLAGSTRKSADDLDAHVRAWRKAQGDMADAAKRTAEQAAQRAEAERVREVERSTDSVVRYAADAFADLFDRTGRGWSGLLDNMLRAFRQTFARIAAEAVIRPIVTPIITGLVGGGAGAAAGGGGLLSGVGDFFGLSSLSRALPSVGDLFGNMGLGGIGDALGLGSLSGIGSLIGPAAGMFGVGSFLGSLVAGNSQARQTNSMIGAGLGTALGLIGGGPLGAIAGGIIGGLIGPGESVKGYGYRVTGTGTGGLAPLDYTYFNESGAQNFREAEQAIAAINQYVAQRGLTIGGSSIVGGNKNGPDYSHADSGSFNEAFGKLYFGAANDNRLNAALQGRSFDPTSLQTFVEGYFQIRDLAETPAERLARQLEEVNRQFDELTTKAREYGFAEADLAAARQRALDQINGADRQAAQGLLSQLAYGPGSALAPEQQYFAAVSQLNAARQSLDAGGSLADYTAVAQQVLPVARGYLGTSTRYAQLTADIAGTVAARGGDPAGLAALVEAQAGGTDVLRATVATYGERQVTALEDLLREVRRQTSTIEAWISRLRAA